MDFSEIKKKIFGAHNQPLCLYPHMNILMTADGRYKPCCRWSETLSDNGRELSVDQGDSLKDAWNSTELQQLRLDMLNGKKNRKCSACWEEEKSGIKSMRHDSFNYGYTYSEKSSKKSGPIRLDIYPSNRCNLRCRICSADYSTGWINESKETLGIEGKHHVNLSIENWEQIESWLPDVVEIGLFGGEPLYNKDCVELLNMMVEKGRSSKISLLINTNGTIYSSELVNLFKKFKKVILNFSIDNLGEKFEYERKGGNWNKTVEVLKNYLAQGGVKHQSQIECKICCTVSAFNAYNLPETVEWVRKELHPGMKIYLNILHGPMSLSLRNLPEKAKELIVNRLMQSHGEKGGEQEQYKSFGDIVNFTSLQPEMQDDAFLKEIERGDKYRKENYAVVYPAMHASLF